MPSVTKSQEWEAVWIFSNTYPPIWYHGSGVTSIDDLVVSVSNNKGGENPFNVVHTTLDGGIGYTPVPPVGNGRWFTKPGPSSAIQVIMVDVDPVPWNANNLWARTNPTRPAVNLPVFWLELREIPSMIRFLGRVLLRGSTWKSWVKSLTPGVDASRKEIASANLAIQFGWAPLIGDLYKLASFQSSVDKRKREIELSSRSGGYARRISLGSQTRESEATGNANFGILTNFPITVRVSSTTHCWAVCKWRPTSPSTGLPSNDIDLRRHLTAVHPSHILENVWEALPWSWLIDYFTTVGDIIKAGNHFAMTPNGGSVMWTTTTTGTFPGAQKFDLHLSGGTITRVRKERAPCASDIGSIARGQMLGPGQLSVLGSLAVIRKG